MGIQNGYEWDVGRFRRAERSQFSKLSEFKEMADKLVDNARDKEQKVLMNCTGGIKCVVSSSIPEGVGGSVPIKGWCPWIWGVRHGGHMEASLPGQEQQAVAQGGGGGQDDWGSS